MARLLHVSARGRALCGRERVSGTRMLSLLQPQAARDAQESKPALQRVWRSVNLTQIEGWSLASGGSPAPRPRASCLMGVPPPGPGVHQSPAGVYSRALGRAARIPPLEGLDTRGSPMGPPAPVKTGHHGGEPLAGSTPFVLPYIAAGTQLCPRPHGEDTGGSCSGISWVCPVPLPWLMLLCVLSMR